MRSLRVFAVVFSVALVLRLLLIFYLKPYAVPGPLAESGAITTWSQLDWRSVQMAEMEAAGIRCAVEGDIGNIFSDKSGPSAHVSPLYAWFLACLYKLTGMNLVGFRVAQSITAATSTALFAALLPAVANRARLTRGTGIVAAGLATFSPFAIWLEIRGDWEVTIVPLALAALLLALIELHDSAWADTRPALVAGLVLGVGSLLSPVVFLAGLLSIVAEAGFLRANPVRWATNAALILVVCGLTLSPWIYRNYKTFSALVPLRGNFGLELAVGNNPSADGLSPEVGKPARHPFSDPSELEKLEAMGEVAYNRMRFEEACRWISSNPWRFSWLCLRRAELFWFLDDPKLWGRGGRLMSVPTKVKTMGAITLLVFGGLAWLLVARHPYRYLLLCLFAAASLPYVLCHVGLRYRYPTLGLTFLLCAECLARFFRSVNRLTRGRPREPMPNLNS